jgi:hypothetical protein
VSTPVGAATSARAPRENIFTHKFGPLPMWVWLVISAGILLGWSYFRNKSSGQQTQQANTTDASQVPQFVNQTYTTVNPPSAPGTGTGQVTVPNVVGMTDTAGDAAITAVGLKVKDANERKGGGGGGAKISSQSPAGGAMVAQGSTVTLTFGGEMAPGKRVTGGHPRKPGPKPRPRITPKGGG